MHRDVPFFANTEDNTHCFQATMRMVLKYFYPDKEYSWEELERLSAKVEGKWTWSTQMLINLKKMRFELKVIDAFDIDAFIERGGEFLIEIWGKEMGESQILHSDIDQERRLYQEFKKEITWERRAPSLDDIRALLEEGYLIEVGVNAAILNDKEHYAGHSVLLYHTDAHYVYLHDPGLPPQPERRVPIDIFWKAWIHPSEGHQALIGIRLPTDNPTTSRGDAG